MKTYRKISFIMNSWFNRLRGKDPRSVEASRAGFRWQLDPRSCIAESILVNGVWEPETTKLIKELVKPGMHVLDIGANFGYFTVLLAEAVGPTGLVWAFEPTAAFREKLAWHVEKNGLASRVRIVPFGLSDTFETCSISRDASSATLHWTGESSPEKEQIILKPLDRAVEELGIDKIDFIKMDIDGHEPNFLRGAYNTLKRQQPFISLEFAQLCLHVAGSDVKEQARLLRDIGYVICREKTMLPYEREIDFLIECGNYAYSCNVIAIPQKRP